LATLEERPLGSELFRFPEAQRQRMETCWLPATQVPLSLSNDTDELLARRSLFFKNGLPLMVAECFLPALWQRLE
jgi:chorismate--pyruvate lyase